jgi:Spy/CpxP family protein refolding chaperone
MLAVVLLLQAAPGMGQGVGTNIDNARSNRQVLAMGLYPPDIIMRHQQTLGITDAQRGAMLERVKAFQAEVAELQWNLQNEQQQVRQAFAQNDIDSAAVMPKVERMVQMESDFKLAHFRLLIAIKNELTDAQIEMIQQRLKQMRKQRRPE